MKKIFSRNKGFTLVECIIAVAVFGLLSLMVFMILTNASVRASRASESEENLAQLIENVVGDETYKKFDPTELNPKVLHLQIDNVNGTSNSGTLDISYNVISGYKNFIQCPSCSHLANFTDFMSSTVGDPSNDPHMTPEKAIDFDVASDYFVCPNCYNTMGTFQLKCPDCSTTDGYKKASSDSASGYLFTYIKSETGGFECSLCGSTAVMAVNAAGEYISEKAAADGLVVSGMVPNGIRYGETIDWANHDPSTLCNFYYVSNSDPSNPDIAATDSGTIQATLKYRGTSNSSFAGKYTLQLTVNSKPASIGNGTPYFIKVVFPAGYTLDYGTVNPLLPPYEPSNVVSMRTEIDASNRPNLLIKCAAGSFSNLFKNNGLEFTLTSKESGYSFEYDYNKEQSTDPDGEQGLFHWFGGMNVGGSSTFKRADGGYLTEATATAVIS